MLLVTELVRNIVASTTNRGRYSLQDDGYYGSSKPNRKNSMKAAVMSWARQDKPQAGSSKQVDFVGSNMVTSHTSAITL